MEHLLSLVTGALVPCVLWVLDRRRYAIRLRVKVWRIREGGGRGLLRLRVVNHSARDVVAERIEIRSKGDKDYSPIKGVLHLRESLAPGTARTMFLNPGTDEMLALDSQPRVRVLTACERVFQARWVDGVSED